MKNLGKKKARIILSKLRETRRTATMENASFCLDNKGELKYWKMGNDDDTARIRESTKLWRQSWLLYPLDEVIKELEEIYE